MTWDTLYYGGVFELSRDDFFSGATAPAEGGLFFKAASAGNPVSCLTPDTEQTTRSCGFERKKPLEFPSGF